MRLTGYLKVKKNVPMIFKGVKLYKAVYNSQLYSRAGAFRGGYTATGEPLELEKL